MPALEAVMLESVKELPVWPESGAPFLAHCKPKGPLPLAAVVEIRVSPARSVCDTSASAVVGTLTVRLARLVTLLQAPATWRSEERRVGNERLESVKELPVWQESGTPSLANCKPNGPVP